MEEDEDYDSDISDRTVLLADFVNKPQTIDAKRRRLSNLHDKSKAANLRVDENDEPNNITEVSVNRRTDVSPGKNSDSTNWLTSINNYFARMSKNNDVNVKGSDNRGSIDCLSKKSYNSKNNTLDKDNASDIICIDSDDESQTSGKSHDANVNRFSRVNELTSNSEIKVNKPAGISSRRATTNIVQQSKVHSTQRLEEPRIRVLKPSAINARRSTIHFDQTNLQNQNVNENVTFALNRQINDPNVTATNPATTSSGRASTNVFQQRIINPRRNYTQILQENNHFGIRVSKPSVTRKATVHFDESNLDRKLHRKKVELKSNLESDTATQTDKGNHENESSTMAEYPSIAAIVNLSSSERRNDATGKNVEVQDENILTSTSPSNIMLQADNVCTNSEKDIHAGKRFHDHEETQKLPKRIKMNTTEQNSNEPLQESDASNRQNVTSFDHEVSSLTVKRSENKGHGTNETAGENTDHGRDVYNFPFERSCNRIRNSNSEIPSTVADTTINNNERSNYAKSVRVQLLEENTLSSTSLLNSHKNCANIEKLVQDGDNNTISNVRLDTTNKSPDKKDTCNPRDEQNEVTKSKDKLSKDEHQSDALGNKVTGITEKRRDALETFAELQKSELQSNLHDRHQDSNAVSKTDGQLETDKQNQNQQKQKHRIENNKSKIMANESTVEHETKNNDKQIVGTSDRNQATSEGQNTGLANVQDNQTTSETQDKVHDKQRGATQVSNEQSTAESVKEQEGVERIRSTTEANLMATNSGVIASSENKKLIIKFHIYFFTQVKEYILKRFPESVVALDKLIQTLDCDARNGIVPTDVQYSCPNPNCKIVSNYSSSLNNNKENETNNDESQKCVFCKGMRKLHTSYLKRSLSKKIPVGDENLVANRTPAERDNVKEPIGSIEQCRNSQTSEIPSGSSGTIRKTVNNRVSTSTVIETGSSISNKETTIEMAQSSGESKTDNHGITKQILDGVSFPKLNIPLNPSSSKPVTNEGMQNTDTLEQTISSTSITKKRANDGLHEAAGELKRMKTNSNNKNPSNENLTTKDTSSPESGITQNITSSNEKGLNDKITSLGSDNTQSVAVISSRATNESTNIPSINPAYTRNSDTIGSTVNDIIEKNQDSTSGEVSTDTSVAVDVSKTNLQIVNAEEIDKASESTIKSLDNCFTQLKNITKNKDQEESNQSPKRSASTHYNHEIVIKYVCNECTRMYKYSNRLLDHLKDDHKINHSKIPENCVVYECPFCRKLLKFINYNKHLKHHHPQECKESGRLVEERKKEKKMNSEEIRRNKSESSRFKYYCLICNITFESKHAGNLHRKQTHTNPEDKHKHIIKKIRDSSNSDSSNNGRQERRNDEDKVRSALENNSKDRSSKPKDCSDLVGTSEANAQGIITSTAIEKGHASSEAGDKGNTEETIGTGNVENGVVSHEVGTKADTDVESSVKNSNKSQGTSKYVYICDECQTSYYSDYAARVHRKTVHPDKRYRPLFKKIPCDQTHGTEHNIGKSDVLARERSPSSTEVDSGRSEEVIKRSKASLTESKEIQSTGDSAANRTTDDKSQRSETCNDRKKESNIDGTIINIQSNIDRQRKEIISKLFEQIRVTRKRARNKRKNKGRMCIDTDRITVSPDVSKSKDDSTSDLSCDVETLCHRVKRSRRKITSESDDSNLSTGIKDGTSSDGEITPGVTVEKQIESSDSSNNGSKGDDEDHDQRRKGITKLIHRATRSRRKITSESDDSIVNTGDKDVTASDDEITPSDAVEKEDSSNSDSSNIESTYSDDTESNDESNLSEDEDDGDQRRKDKSKLIDDECRVYNRVHKSNFEAQRENYVVQLSRRRRQRRKIKHRRSKTGGAVTKENRNYIKRGGSIQSITGGHTSTTSEEGSASDSDGEEDDLSSGVEAEEEYYDTDEKSKEGKTELIDDECRVYNRVSKSNIEAQCEKYDVKLSAKRKKRRILQYRSLKKTNGAGTSIINKRGGSNEKYTESDDSSYGDRSIRNDESSDSCHTEENSTACEESSNVWRGRNDDNYNSSVGEDVSTASDHETAEESDDSDERSKDAITELIDDECRVYNRVSKSNVEAQCENYDVKLSGKRKTRQTLKQRESRAGMPSARTKHNKRRKTRNVTVGKCTQNEESSDSDRKSTQDKIISTTDIGKSINNSDDNRSDLSYDKYATTASEDETIKSTKMTLNKRQSRLLNLFGDENARIGRNSDEVRNDPADFELNNSGDVQKNQESAARNSEAKLLSDDETIGVSETTIKKRKERIETFFNDDTEIVGQLERQNNINNAEMILHEDDRFEIDQINRPLEELGPDLQNDDVRPENHQNVAKGIENYQKLNMGPEHHRNDDVGPNNSQNVDIGPENQRNDDVGPENHQNVDKIHEDHQNVYTGQENQRNDDVGPDNSQNVAIGLENHLNDDESSEIRQNVDSGIGPEKHHNVDKGNENQQNAIKGLENKQNDIVGPDNLQNYVYTEKENSNEQAVSSNNVSGVNNQSQSSKVQSCLENVQVTNVTSVANKVHIFICQTCSFATDKYDNAIRHCQNKLNRIEDPVIYCEVCQINFDNTCFERHTVSHTKYLLVVKIKFSHHWLFSNWQAVFENNRILLSDAENMQVQSIYKTYCVKMSVKVDGPWQTALYLCAKCNTCVPHLEIEKHVSQKCTISNFMTHSCGECNLKFSTSEMLRHHEIYHTGEDDQPFKTIVFNDRHDEKFNLNLKINKEQQRIIDIYRCLCGLCFTSLKNFKFHFLDCESQTNNGAPCPKCTEPRRFPPTELEDHLSVHRSILTCELRTQQVAFQTESNCNIQLSNFQTSNRIPQNAMQVRPNEELISEDTNVEIRQGIMTEPLEGEESLDVLKEELDIESTAQQNTVEDFDINNDTLNEELLLDMNEDTSLENGNEVEEELGVKNTSRPIQVTPNDEDIKTDMLKDETLSQNINKDNPSGNLDNTTTEQDPQITKTINSGTQIPSSDDDLIIKKDLLKEESLTQNNCQVNLNINESLRIEGTEQNATHIASSAEDLNIKMDVLKFESTNTHEQNLIVESGNSQENVQDILGTKITGRETTETTTNDVDLSINTNEEIRERITDTLADNRFDEESSQEVMIVEDSVHPIVIDDSDDDVQVIEVNTDAQRRIGLNRNNDWLFSI